MYRQSIIRSLRAAQPAPRLFSTQARLQKSPVESVKDAAKTVDRTISDKVVKGIEKGEQAAASVKSSAPADTAEAKAQASELAGQAKGKAQELSGEAKGKAQEVKGEAKGKAQEVKGEAKSKLS